MKGDVCIVSMVLSLQVVAVAMASEAPVAVSPGGSDQATVVAGRCPTFSWGALSGARAYELAVFEVEESTGALRAETLAERAPLALWAEIPTAALSWTPASDNCLVMGTRYAWFVRAVGGVDSGWSEARLFEVRAAPTREEVEEALATLRRYLDTGPEQRGDGNLATLADAIAATRPAATAAAPTAPGGTPGAAAEAADTRGMADPAIGIQSTIDSSVDGSRAIHGEATAATGIADGVRGVTASASGTGVRGTASATNGLTAGVWGAANSPTGFGGFFFNLGFNPAPAPPGGPGLYASGALNTSPDLVLGGSPFLLPGFDAGRIHSDPFYPSSDLVMRTNDDFVIELDHDGGGENSDFSVLDKDGQTLFNVDSGGITFVLGNLFITGEPQGGLVSIDEVEDIVDKAIEDHLAGEHPKIVFVTSQIWDGDLGGLGGADNKCQARAVSAGLIGTFKAWISGSSASEEARDRMSRADVEYRRVDYVKVADNWTDLTDGTLDAPINVNENGNTVGGNLTAYTNTDADGSIHETNRECGLNPGNQWNNNDQFASGGYGTVGATNSTWSWVNNNACDNERRLYCIQQ